MTVHFAFGDENGSYQKARSYRFTQRYPYFIRSTLLIRADEWQTLRDRMDALRSTVAATTPSAEIKWAHLWQLKRFENRRERIDPKGHMSFLCNCTFADALQYVEQSLSALHDLKYARVILTVSHNGSCPRINATTRDGTWQHERHLRFVCGRHFAGTKPPSAKRVLYDLS